MSGSASGQGYSSESRSVDLTPKQYANQRGFVKNELKDRIRGNVNAITGPFVAPIGQQEQEALSAFGTSAFGSGGLGAAADQQLISTLQGQQNPFLTGAIDAAIAPILRNAQLQELRDRALFTGSGQKIQGSTAFTDDRTRSLAETERNVGDVASQIAFSAFQQERQNQLQAVSLANARFAEQREGIATLALPRLIEQLGIDRGNAELQRRFTVIEQALTQLASLTTPTLGTISSASGGGGGISVGQGGGGVPA